LGGHPEHDKINGVEISTGALGHGLPIAVGMAIANKIKKNNIKFYVVCGDGEINEGSVWEAALFASKNKLNKLIVFLDYNKWQATGKSENIMSLNPLKSKWKSFGWIVHRINGHKYDQMYDVIKYINSNDQKPKIFICDTIKGKGVSFMENDNNWHYKVPNINELNNAIKLLK